MEQPVLLGQSGSLVGVLTEASETKRDESLPAVILLNAGLVHRVGPNRLYVRMARNLATLGFLVLRFDFSGVGDSAARSDHLPFHESSVAEAQEAMDYLWAAKGSEQFVLMGLCSGAAASLRAACSDRRVIGAVLINARDHLHDHTDDELSARIRNRALARHYWRLALSSSFSVKNSLRVLRGAIDYRKIVPAMIGVPLSRLFARARRAPPAANYLEGEMRSLAERGVRLLHVYSEGDEGLDYYRLMVGDALRRWNTGGLLELQVVPAANHAFTLLWSQEYLLQLVQDWMSEIFYLPVGKTEI
jgi:pimeloyl-ACP methyl ester carboxylesterase